MKKNIKDMKRKGFTLVELIVVIAIIAILAALAVPRVERFVEDARLARREADFRSVYTAVNAGYTSWIAESSGNLLTASGDTEILTATDSGIHAAITDLFPAGNTAIADEATENPKDDTTWGITLTADANSRLTKIVVTNNGYVSTDGSKPAKP